MKKISFEKYAKPEKKTKRGTPNSKTAYVVFGVLDKYNIDYSNGWGKKLMGGMLRKQKNGHLEILIADMEDRLRFMKEKEYKPWEENIYNSIMASEESRTKYLWSKLISKK